MPIQSKGLCPWSTEVSVSPFYLLFLIVFSDLLKKGNIAFKSATMFSRSSIRKPGQHYMDNTGSTGQYTATSTQKQFTPEPDTPEQVPADLEESFG